ncbi:aromatic ring-hydroxylating dioxygenase subunit alpha [Henriciella aquimarina]|uniref:aromatic ring-hydroxylating dioxygenase subunit alpha n=1 Tax=Henriciella aquimarina TaxID=545261 RepID=UPI001301F82E|nr:aromatic ring-hydroxylating dioxygenase subunit alpha [Henriciella aquimarina]
MSFMRNSWYCAGWSTEVADKPVHRKILGEEIVLYRTESGKVIALGDKCPHRFAPLHQGRIKGENLECPYHGLQFGGDGKCVFNPHGEGKIPRSAKTDAFILEERGGALWIWMGEPEKADPEQIIETEFLADKTFVSRTGYHPVGGNYMLVVDNLLDLTHAQFLHPETVFGKGSADRWQVSKTGKPSEGGEEVMQEVWFEETEDTMTAHQMMRNKPKPPLWDPIVDYEMTDLHSWITWYAPSNLRLTLELSERGSNEGPATMIVMHFLTPIDEFNCYYFFAIGWDTNIEDQEAADRVLGIVLQTIIDEDGPIVEDCQAYMGETSDLFSLRPVLLPTDGVAVKARRRLEELIQDEQEQAKVAAE